MMQNKNEVSWKYCFIKRSRGEFGKVSKHMIEGSFWDFVYRECLTYTRFTRRRFIVKKSYKRFDHDICPFHERASLAINVFFIGF